MVCVFVFFISRNGIEAIPVMEVKCHDNSMVLRNLVSTGDNCMWDRDGAGEEKFRRVLTCTVYFQDILNCQ